MNILLHHVYEWFLFVLSVFGLYFGLLGAAFLLPQTPRAEPRHLRRFAVLLPARNEERCIAGVIESIRRQNYPAELVEIYVIPNNCTDDTAARAQRAGAQLLPVRHAVASKGEALREAFATLLATQRHEAYCVLDADNELDREFLYEMNRALDHARVAKSRILAKNAQQGRLCACYEAYFCNANLLLNTARERLGLSARLIGTGFAVRRDLMEELGGWSAVSLTEDAEFYAQLSLRRERIAFAERAITYDEQPLRWRDSLTQRRRWMSGILHVAREHLPALGRESFCRGSFLALDAFFQLAYAYVQAWLLPMLLLAFALSPQQSLAALPAAALRFYGGALALGALSLLLEGRLTRHTLRALPLYPLFLFSFFPLQTLALCRPHCTWTPIAHSGVRLDCAAAQKRTPFRI